MQKPNYLQRPNGEQIAYHQRLAQNNKQPGLVFLSGFRSDMSGSKALACEDYAKQHDLSFVRFDYYGHGLSSGEFIQGTISRWLADTLAVLDEVAPGPQILIGSSMGGWLALLAAKARPQQIKGLVTIAAAPDFTEDLMWLRFTSEQQEELLQKKICYLPSDYGEPYPVTLQLIEDGRKHILLSKPLELNIPIRLLHGERDYEVPWQISFKILEKITQPDVTLTLIKSGGHRLSEPAQLGLLFSTLSTLRQTIAGAEKSCPE